MFAIYRAGQVLVHEPVDSPPLDGKALLVDAARLGRAGFTDRVERDGLRRVYALVPVRDGRGAAVGLAGAVVDLDGGRLGAMLATRLGPEQSIDIVDSHGVVIASTDAARRLRARPPGRELADLIRERQATAGPEEGAEVLAFAPLAAAHWGVLVRQPRSAAYGAIGALSRPVALAGALLAAMAVLFAWGAAVSVTRPLGRLTQAAERLARGELDAPIPPLGADEVGRLGAALERMRVALRDSLAHAERADGVLEDRVRERTVELEALNRELNERDEARCLALGKVIAAQEAERKRIARELHDETTQSLAALAMKLDGAKGLIADASAARSLEEAQALAVHTLDDVHRLIVDLRPSVLDDLGLQSAIAWYAERCLKARGIAVRCEFSGLERRFPVGFETAVFRTAQEAMTNIARHAHAEKVLVQCARVDDTIIMEIEDDGCGFDPSAIRPSDRDGRGFGLLGMRERMDLLGGTVEIDSAPGEGTRILLRVPIPDERGTP